MNTSREGTLSNGRRFVFYGADQVSGTFEEFLDERGLFYLRTRDFIVQEETVEDMLEVPELYQWFSICHLAPEWAHFVAYYFAESNSVLFEVDHDDNYTFRWGPRFAIVVNQESGAVSRFDEGWRH